MVRVVRLSGVCERSFVGDLCRMDRDALRQATESLLAISFRLLR